MNACEPTALPEIKKVAIIKKELCDNVIVASIHLSFEMIHLNQPIRRGRMSFGKTSNANPETTAVTMDAGFVRLFNESGVHRDRRGFGIGVAGFPEGHPATPNRLVEMDHFKAKVDAGDDYIVTQLF